MLAKKESCPASIVYQSLTHSYDDAVGCEIQSDGADLYMDAIWHQLAVSLQLPTPGVAAASAVAAVEITVSWCEADGGGTVLVELVGDDDAW